MRKEVTRDDVARLAGTSTAVVSYVVNGGPRPVSAKMRSRVLTAIETLGYRPNRLARALRGSRSGLAGLILPDTETPYFSALATALEAELFSRGLLALIGSSRFDHHRELRYAEAFGDLKVDGLLIASVGASSEEADRLSTPGPRTVYVHRAGGDKHWPLVAHDDIAAGDIGTQHLLDHGHKQVLCLAGLADGPMDNRVEGWRQALARNAVTGRPSELLRIPNNRGEAATAAEIWLATHPDATAVMAATDELAFGLIRAAATLGRRIPEDIALVGCDGINEGLQSVPRLSSVKLSLTALARAAVARLLDEAPSNPTLSVTIPVTLAPNESCGCRCG